MSKNHPLRLIRAMADKALAELDAEFQAIYSCPGRLSIEPEKLLKGLLLLALYTNSANRLQDEQIGYNVPFHWILGLGLDEPVWDHSSFSANQERLIKTDTTRSFLQRSLSRPKRRSFFPTCTSGLTELSMRHGLLPESRLDRDVRL